MTNEHENIKFKISLSEFTNNVTQKYSPNTITTPPKENLSKETKLPTKSEKLSKCEICGRNYKNSESLSTHIYKYHNEIAKTKLKKGKDLHAIAEETAKKNNFSKAISIKEPKLPSDKIGPMQFDQRSLDAVNAKQDVIIKTTNQQPKEECETKSEANNIIDSMKLTTKDTRIKCEVCGKDYKNEKTLKLHQSKFHEKTEFNMSKKSLIGLEPLKIELDTPNVKNLKHADFISNEQEKDNSKEMNQKTKDKIIEKCDFPSLKLKTIVGRNIRRLIHGRDVESVNTLRVNHENTILLPEPLSVKPLDINIGGSQTAVLNVDNTGAENPFSNVGENYIDMKVLGKDEQLFRNTSCKVILCHSLTYNMVKKANDEIRKENLKILLIKKRLEHIDSSVPCERYFFGGLPNKKKSCFLNCIIQMIRNIGIISSSIEIFAGDSNDIFLKAISGLLILRQDDTELQRKYQDSLTIILATLDIEENIEFDCFYVFSRIIDRLDKAISTIFSLSCELRCVWNAFRITINYKIECELCLSNQIKKEELLCYPIVDSIDEILNQEKQHLEDYECNVCKRRKHFKSVLNKCFGEYILIVFKNCKMSGREIDLALQIGEQQYKLVSTIDHYTYNGSGHFTTSIFSEKEYSVFNDLTVSSNKLGFSSKSVILVGVYLLLYKRSSQNNKNVSIFHDPHSNITTMENNFTKNGSDPVERKGGVCPQPKKRLDLLFHNVSANLEKKKQILDIDQIDKLYSLNREGNYVVCLSETNMKEEVINSHMIISNKSEQRKGDGMMAISNGLDIAKISIITS